MGQSEPIAAPTGTQTPVSLNPKAARVLAYYESDLNLGVLAPRGWYCLGTYGSGGQFLYVSPQPIDAEALYSSKDRGFYGPAIEISERLSDQHGDSLEKARIIARAFPAYKALALEILTGFGYNSGEYPLQPYPSDKLTYKSNSVVEYRTAAQAEGLGTHSNLRKSGRPIEGVAILNGEPPSLILLSVRLPEELAGVAPVIVRQVEREVLNPASDHRRQQ